jgi:hypothetical protein
MHQMKPHLFCFGLTVLLIASCEKKSEIKVYRVAKAPLEESASSQGDTMPTNLGSPAAAAATAPPVASTAVATPPNWEPQPLSQMRQASFVVKAGNGEMVDISLVSLGTSAANVLDNVNRWLSQLGQPPIPAEKLGDVTQHLTTSIGDVTIVDLAGLPKDGDPLKDGRIIAAMAGTNSGTLFFKMRGNAALTEAQKGNFIKWVAAVCNGQVENKAPPMAAMPSRDSTAPEIKWKTPDGWTEVPASSMRYASFNASGSAGDKVDISIVTFPGDGGSDADNVNRWRQQIGLAPVDDKGVATLVVPVNSGDTQFSTLDMTSGGGRVIAAWTRRDGRSWFFKMSGPAAALEREKPKFFDFLRSINFHS